MEATLARYRVGWALFLLKGRRDLMAGMCTKQLGTFLAGVRNSGASQNNGPLHSLPRNLFSQSCGGSLELS